jgi:pilus assembly protein Flp/PilA
MTKLASIARSFVRDEEGATMVEYALLVAVIAIVVVVGAKALGGSASTKFQNAATSVATP